MGRPRLDLAGQTIGHLFVVRLAHVEHGTHWECRCACGVTCIIAGSKLSLGRTVSCGCRKRTRSDKGTGHAGTPEYCAWSALRRRCTDPESEDYAAYGGRGITVCDRWRESFENFLADVGLRPSTDHTIDRIDNDRGYEPGNVRWAVMAIQNRNKRTTRLSVDQAAEALARYEAGEKPKVIAARFGVSANLISATVYQRKQRGRKRAA